MKRLYSKTNCLNIREVVGLNRGLSRGCIQLECPGMGGGGYSLSGGRARGKISEAVDNICPGKRNALWVMSML